MRWLSFLPAFLPALAPLAAAAHDEPTHYEHGADSVRQADVPRGKVAHHEWNTSQVFPGTSRSYWVYVPRQYDAAHPAALMVFQDGEHYVSEERDFRVPIVFDNLIHQQQMPVTIGVFINPGQPGNRSFEYDTLSDAYANFLLTEILPEVEKSYNISHDPRQRAICGISSGGICAFTVAWQRPDQFRKVLSHVGSFADIRGGHNYPPMIRKTEPKPIRVFLQAGSNDLDIEYGNWPLANQQMNLALRFKNYDSKFVYGGGAHTANHGGAILPDSLRWLWRAEK